MEKLLELLNEYWGWSFELEIDDDTWEPTWWIVDAHQDTFEVTSYYITMQIISKRFWFIERLVENNKIDLKEFHRLCWIINQDSEYWNWTPQDYEQVIMYLSISDTPIDDLVSLLKE